MKPQFQPGIEDPVAGALRPELQLSQDPPSPPDAHRPVATEQGSGCAGSQRTFEDSLIYEAPESQPRLRRLAWRICTGLLWLGFVCLLVPAAHALPSNATLLLAEAIHWFGECFNAMLPVRSALRRLADPLLLSGLPLGIGLSMVIAPEPDPLSGPAGESRPAAEWPAGAALAARAEPDATQPADASPDPMRHCRRMVARHDAAGQVLDITPM